MARGLSSAGQEYLAAQRPSTVLSALAHKPSHCTSAEPPTPDGLQCLVLSLERTQVYMSGM